MYDISPDHVRPEGVLHIGLVHSLVEIQVDFKEKMKNQEKRKPKKR